MDKPMTEREMKKDLRMIRDSFVHHVLAAQLAEAQDMNKLQLERIAELGTQLSTISQERDLLRNVIINAAGILNPYMDGVAELIRASTHVTQQVAVIQEVMKAEVSTDPDSARREGHGSLV
jgi:hypothetical protein